MNYADRTTDDLYREAENLSQWTSDEEMSAELRRIELELARREVTPPRFLKQRKQS